MNIFYLHNKPVIAASLTFDTHAIKMCVENMQILCTNVNILYPEFKSDALMKRCYENHPCTIWARSSSANFKWLLDYSQALFAEYTLRYGKIHACQLRFELLASAFTECINILNSQGLTAFTKPALAMPDEFKRDCPIESYKLYYDYKAQSEIFKVGMYELALSLDMKFYSNNSKVRKISRRMVYAK